MPSPTNPELPTTQVRKPLGTHQPAGSASSASTWTHVLSVGTRLGEFEITGVIGEGGFGIVYLAFDHTLERRVALKEYMPSSMATRTKDSVTISVKYAHQQESFQAGLRSFVNEARLLAQFDHPALVKVHRFWEANGTAYMVMPFYEGPTLRAALTQFAQPPDEAWLLDLLAPLLDALSLLHHAQCFHRDIAPDNILLTAAGPLLLDFGAARRVIGEANQTLTVILKPGYAPIEQYGEVASMAQGAWTDIYALCCVVYTAITGKAPMASMQRLLDDKLEPLTQLAAGRYSERFLQAVDAGLSLKPKDRPKDIAQFRVLLGVVTSINPVDDSAARTLSRAAIKPKAKTQRRLTLPATTSAAAEVRQQTPHAAAKRTWLKSIAAAIVLAAAVLGVVKYAHQSKTATSTAVATQSASATSVGNAATITAPPVSQQTSMAASSADTSLPPENSSAPTATTAFVSASAPPNPVSAPAATSLAANKPSPHSNESTVAPKLATQSAVVKTSAYTQASSSIATMNTMPANGTAAPKSNRSSQRCRELLQEASLETLSAEDNEYLRTQCK